MKKVFFITLSSLFIANIAVSQTVASTSKITEELEIVSPRKALSDVRAIDQIRKHLIQDKDLQEVYNYYVEQGKVQAEVVIDKTGAITDVKIVESLSLDHDLEIKKSIKKLARVNPIKIDGKVVRQKVVIPIYFR